MYMTSINPPCASDYLRHLICILLPKNYYKTGISHNLVQYIITIALRSNYIGILLRSNRQTTDFKIMWIIFFLRLSDNVL